MKNCIKFAIIIPTRNEAANLRKLLPILVKLHPKSPIWIVDDDSPDHTEEFIRRFSHKNPQVHLILRKDKRGRGSAVIDGLKEALKNKEIPYFLEMDADFSHSPDEITKLLAEAKKPQRHPGGVRPDSRIIIGSRHIRGSKFVDCSPLRILLSTLANWYAGLILSIPAAVRHPRGSPKGLSCKEFPWGGGNRITDYTNGFRLYPRYAVKVLLNSKIHEKGYVMLSETAYILYKKGFTFKEVQTIFVNRKVGKSNATILEFLRSIPAIVKIYLIHH